MGLCEKGIQRLYEMNDGDIEYVRDVAEQADYFDWNERKRAEEIARKAKYEYGGRYAHKLEEETKIRIEKGLQGIVGQDVLVRNVEKNTFVYANVKKQKYVGNGIVRLTTDKGIKEVDVDRNMTTNGMEIVELGSEVDKLLNTTTTSEYTTMLGDKLYDTAQEDRKSVV